MADNLYPFLLEIQKNIYKTRKYEKNLLKFSLAICACPDKLHNCSTEYVGSVYVRDIVLESSATHVETSLCERSKILAAWAGTARTRENGNEWISGERPRLLEIATLYKLNAKFHRGFVVRRGTQFQIAAACFFPLLSWYLITHAVHRKKEREEGERKMTRVRWHVVVQFIERIYKNWTCPDGRIPSNSVSAVFFLFFFLNRRRKRSNTMKTMEIHTLKNIYNRESGTLVKKSFYTSSIIKSFMFSRFYIYFYIIRISNFPQMQKNLQSITKCIIFLVKKKKKQQR